MITFTKEQLSEVMCKHAEKENGLHDLLEAHGEGPGIGLSVILEVKDGP